MAPLLMPKVRPPTPKKNTRNKPLRRPEEIPIERAIPPNTPPSHLSFAFRVIVLKFKQEMICKVKIYKKNRNPIFVSKASSSFLAWKGFDLNFSESYFS